MKYRMQSYRASDKVCFISHCFSSSRLKTMSRLGRNRFSTFSANRLPKEPVPPVTRMFWSLSIYLHPPRDRSAAVNPRGWTEAGQPRAAEQCGSARRSPSDSTERGAKQRRIPHVDCLERTASHLRERPLRQLEVIHEIRPVRIERNGIDTAERRQVREPAVGPDKSPGAGDDGRLPCEVHLRFIAHVDVMNPGVLRRSVVEVVIDTESRIQHHHIGLFGERGNRGRDERT